MNTKSTLGLLPILLLGVIAGSSCSTVTPVAVNTRLELPPPLELPKISAEDVACLSDSAYDRLVRITDLLESRNATLRAIIETTHE